MKRRQWIQVGLLCLALTVDPAHVKRVIDGDTFVLWAVNVGGEERVRVLGVDTPERGKPGYTEATSYTRAWLAQGPSELVACKKDSFGRLLGAVTRDGDSLAGKLIQQGLAHAYEGGTK